MSFPLLAIGSRGPYVTQLQNALNLAPTSQPRLDPDGAFGPITKRRVLEFQRQKGLYPDGVVGTDTWNALSYWIAILVAEHTPPAGPREAKEQQYRNRIVEEAKRALAMWGWSGPVQPSPLLPQIAAARCADPGNPLRPRQGGAALTAIFSMAGASAGKIALCASISVEMENTYRQPDGTPDRRNKINMYDIGSWCGVFTFYIYKMAGLNIGSWTAYGMQMIRGAGQAPSPTQKLAWVPYDGVARAGDIGVLPTIANHHYIVVEDVGGGSIRSIDGNIANPAAGQFSPWNSVIGYRETHARSEMKNAGGFFLRPIWENLVAQW
jgi:hypothetical protein